MGPIGWSYAGDGHGLEELEYGVVECMWHVFNKYSRDVVGAGCFVAREESEGFVEDCAGEFACDYVLCMGRCGWDCVQPGECAVGVDIGVGGEQSIF